MNILRELKPKFYFASHLHVKFAAIYPHIHSSPSNNNCNNINADVNVPVCFDDTHVNTSTRFLALDKVLPRRYVYIYDNVYDYMFDF